MEENEVKEVLEPQYGFFEVTIVTEQEDDNGKVKKIKEVHLVDATCVTDVEKKVADEMKGTMWDWKIAQVRQSKISLCY